MIGAGQDGCCSIRSWSEVSVGAWWDVRIWTWRYDDIWTGRGVWAWRMNEQRTHGRACYGGCGGA